MGNRAGRRRHGGKIRHASAASALASIRKNRIGLKGPVTTPIGGGFRSVNVALRKELDLYACLRPCKCYRGILRPSRTSI